MARPYELLRAGYPYVKTIGTFRKMNYPSDIAIGKDGRLYVLGLRKGGTGQINSGPVTVFNLDDEDLGSFDQPDGGIENSFPVADDQFLWPVQLVLDSEENVYVSDEACHRISMFTKWGKFIGIWGEHGNGDGQLNRPSGIAFDPEDNLHVVDTMNHRVQKFTREGRFIGKWGSFGEGDGQLNMPWGIHVDELGDVYIADWRNDRVQKFTADGEFIFKFGTSGSADGEFNRPAGVAVDRDGDIYVSDWSNNRVQLFTAEGRFVQQFLGDATLSASTIERLMTRTAKYRRIRAMANLEPEKRLSGPKSVRVDDHIRMYVPDFENYRVQIYEKQAYPLTPEEVLPPLRVETLSYM